MFLQLRIDPGNSNRASLLEAAGNALHNHNTHMTSLQTLQCPSLYSSCLDEALNTVTTKEVKALLHLAEVRMVNSFLC